MTKITWAAVLGLAVALGAAEARADILLKLDGIAGASLAKKDHVDVLSFELGAQSGGATRNGGAGAGKAAFRDVVFRKRVDAASTKLFLHVATRKPLKEAVFTFRRSNDAAAYYTVRLTDVLVTSFQQAAAGPEDVPTETVTLSVAKITIEVASQRADGKLGAPARGAFDVRRNVAQ